MFRIDSLPPGRYTLEILHSLLDTLGIRVVSDTIVVAAGQVYTTALGVPSAAGVVAAVCPSIKRQLGPAAIVGHILKADSDQPAIGADVSAAWMETSATPQAGVHSDPRLRKATVASDGTFRLCGLPATLNGTLQAALGTAQTAEVPIETTQELLILRSLRLPSALRDGSAVVTGRVTGPTGVPVGQAHVTVQGSSATTISAVDGTFTLHLVHCYRQGQQAVLVRKVGYAPVVVPLDITSRGPNRVTMQLGEYRPQLAAVNVKASKCARPHGLRSPQGDRSGALRYRSGHPECPTGVYVGHVTSHDWGARVGERARSGRHIIA